MIWMRAQRILLLCILLTLIGASLVENLGFRQLLTFWRAMAFVDLLRGKKSWGAMERQGLKTPPPEAAAALQAGDGAAR